MLFNPNEHLMKLKGKDYLEVKWRLVWFREDHPADSGWGISTSIVQFDEKQGTVKATITDPEGRIVATGTKQEVPKDFGDYLEKAETGAIGRALALLGYGTQFAPEMEEGTRIVDSPVERKPPPPPTNRPAAPPDSPRAETTQQPAPEKTINDAQVKRLYTVATTNGWSHELVKGVLKIKRKWESTKDIPISQYDKVVEFFETNKPPAPTPEGGSN